MAQVFVSQEPAWYQGIASLKNYYEKEIELRLLKYATDVFTSYYCFQSAFTFQRGKNKARPDLILISKNLKEWRIVELELIGKGLSHTNKQLTVFSKPKFDLKDFIDHCIEKVPDLKDKNAQLEELIRDNPSKILVVFDTYDKPTLDKIKKKFRDIDICVFEVYRTRGHELETYRFSGDYPYVSSDYTFLKAYTYNTYEVYRPHLLQDYIGKQLFVQYKSSIYKSELIRETERNKDLFFLNINESPFPPTTDLLLHVSEDGKFIIETVK